MNKTTRNDLPNTVVLVGVSDVVADSFFIQQSWDKTEVRINPKSYTADIYYERLSCRKADSQ
jgi:hypothetical protein